MSAPAYAVAKWLSGEAERLHGTDEADALTTALIAVCAVYEVDPADAVQGRELIGERPSITQLYGLDPAAPAPAPAPNVPAASLYPQQQQQRQPVTLSAEAPAPPDTDYSARDATEAEQKKTAGNVAMVNRRFEDAVEQYTLPISLRGDVPGYYGNRAAGYLELGESNCTSVCLHANAGTKRGGGREGGGGGCVCACLCVCMGWHGPTFCSG